MDFIHTALMYHNKKAHTFQVNLPKESRELFCVSKKVQGSDCRRRGRFCPVDWLHGCWKKYIIRGQTFLLHVTGIEKRGKEYGRKEEDPAEPDTQTKQAPI